MKLNSIEEIISEIRAGRMVIMTDDEERENEGDIIFAASAADAEKVNFMMKHARGLICVPMTAEGATKLGIREMVEAPRDSMGTAFGVSVDASSGITTGISAHDRARTIEILGDATSQPEGLVSPGHVFPLIAKKGGVLRRAGHTEAAVDLATLAGLPPTAVICEIVSDDGTMARLSELKQFAKTHKLKMGTIRDLIEYRRRTDKLIEFISEAQIPTTSGDWRIRLYRSLVDDAEHVALIKGELNEAPTLVRVHSECFTGDVLGSLRCDCRDQLNRAMDRIQQEGRGAIIYMRQEGRGIGLANKLKAYNLQDQGVDTVRANEVLGFKPDLREYGIGAQIIRDLGLSQLRLITNNPRKIVGLEGHGLQVVERVALSTPQHSHNSTYLKTKKEKLGHMLDLSEKRS